MTYYLEGARAELDPEEQDELHAGSFTASYRTSYRSADGGFEAGLWDFAGEMTTPSLDGFEMAIVLTDGSAQIECEGETYTLSVGDLFVLEGPTGDYQVRSDGFRATYLRRFRTPPKS